MADEDKQSSFNAPKVAEPSPLVECVKEGHAGGEWAPRSFIVTCRWCGWKYDAMPDYSENDE